MITLDKFRNLVPYRIFARGEDYYESGAVSELEEESPGEWTAIVSGTEDYSVEISLDGNEIESWYCDCPYDGEMCKHVVATLLAIREEEKKAKRSAFSAKKVEAEEAVVLEDSQEMPDAGLANVDVQQLLSLAKPQELSRFICDYASKHPEFKTALLDRFFVKELSAKPKDKDYKAEVEKAFTDSGRKSSRYSYRYDDDWDPDWETIFNRLDTLLEKAQLFLSVGQVGNAIAIALQTLRSIGEHYDDELIYNDDLYVSDYCERAGDVLMRAAEHSAATQAQKMEILRELEQMAQMSVYRHYDVYDVDDLMMQVNLLAQPADKALALIDRLLEERKDEYDLYEIVLRKVSLLQEQHEEQKAADTIRRYLYLPEIRKREVRRLVDSGQYDEALRLLDEGITIADQKGHIGTVNDWRRAKLEIYEATGRTAEAIEVCRTLFMSGRDRMEYYDKLKKMVPKEQWKDFLDGMMKKADFDEGFSFGENDKAEIYVKEKDYDRLYQWLLSVRYGQLDALMEYSHHLKNTHSEPLIALYTSLLKDYAERNMGRNHYERVAHALSCMQKLNGGRTAVQWLLSEFRVKYKRRPAMMEILGKF